MIHPEDKDMILGALGAMLLLPFLIIGMNYYATFTVEVITNYSPPIDYSNNPWE